MQKKKLIRLLLSDIMIFNNNNMDISKDVWKYISQWLSDIERFYLMIICKEMIKINLLFDEQHDHFDIFESKFYHNFTNIKVNMEVYYLGKLMPWPYNIRQIELTNKEKIRSKKIFLPNGITHLTTGKKFKDFINIPSTVIYLTFNGPLNQSLNLIPSSVTHLRFDNKFNESIDGLSSSIIHLTFGYSFNQPIDNKIPQLVTHLTFGMAFNQSISGNIPTSVTHLTFGSFFNQPVNGFIPSSVTHLTFALSFRQTIDKIPLSVTYLTLPGRYPYSFKNLSVTHLIFQGFNYVLKVDNIPSSVIQITLYYHNDSFFKLFRHPIPSSIKEIIFKDNVITEKKIAYINNYVDKETKIIFSNP